MDSQRGPRSRVVRRGLIATLQSGTRHFPTNARLRDDAEESQTSDSSAGRQTTVKVRGPIRLSNREK